jgi:SAM-dependent methyltransferase
MVLRLNLGCGDKLYPRYDGWVNVDIVKPSKSHLEVSSIPCEEVFSQSTQSSNPIWHQSLLQKLEKIDDSIADEVHAYHVIEHFFIDEIEGVLKEWKRVLKKGGRIVLEQPDVIKCAANLLAGYHNGDQVLAFNLGLLGFFGAGTSQTPYMAHKCGWHFETLKKQLETVGFINVLEADALTHMKKVRDFRIIAEKP